RGRAAGHQGQRHGDRPRRGGRRRRELRPEGDRPRRAGPGTADVMIHRTGAPARARAVKLALAGGLGALALACADAHAGSLEILSATGAGAGAHGTEFTVKTQVLVIMTLLGLLPVLAMMTTSFTRFVIVLSLLRQALGLQQGLPNRVVTGVALILTMLVMR